MTEIKVIFIHSKTKTWILIFSEIFLTYIENSSGSVSYMFLNAVTRNHLCIRWKSRTDPGFPFVETLSCNALNVPRLRITISSFWQVSRENRKLRHYFAMKSFGSGVNCKRLCLNIATAYALSTVFNPASNNTDSELYFQNLG